MKRKLPTDAFSHFVGLGKRRSFQAIAERFGVTRQAVAKRAHRELWIARAAEIDAAARQATKLELLQTRDELYTRNAKMWGMVQAKALEALRDKPFRNSRDAVRALDTANSAMTRMLFMRETTRLELAAATGAHFGPTENDENSAVESLTDNQKMRRLIQAKERKERNRASNSPPTDGAAPE